MRGISIIVGSVLLAPALLGASAQPRGELRFAAGVFHPGDAAAKAPVWFHDAGLTASERGSRYLTAVTRGPMGPQERAEIERLGAEVLGYLPVNGYRIRVQPALEAALRRLPFIVWLGAPPSPLQIKPE